MARRKSIKVKTFTHLEDLITWVKSKEEFINAYKDTASIKIDYIKSIGMWVFELLG